MSENSNINSGGVNVTTVTWMSGHAKKKHSLVEKEHMDQDTMGKVEVDLVVVPLQPNSNPLPPLITKHSTPHIHQFQEVSLREIILQLQ